MGWWKTNIENDVIGDEAADTITQLLKDINSLYCTNGFSPPNLGELLAVLSVSCNMCQKSGLIISEKPISNLKAIYHEDIDEFFSTKPPNELSVELEGMITEAIKTISYDYKLTIDRIPRVTEVFACFSFVLGYRPENYLSEMEGKSVAVIEPTI